MLVALTYTIRPKFRAILNDSQNKLGFYERFSKEDTHFEIVSHRETLSKKVLGSCKKVAKSFSLFEESKILEVRNAPKNIFKIFFWNPNMSCFAVIFKGRAFLIRCTSCSPRVTNEVFALL